MSILTACSTGNYICNFFLSLRLNCSLSHILQNQLAKLTRQKLELFVVIVSRLVNNNLPFNRYCT